MTPAEQKIYKFWLDWQRKQAVTEAAGAAHVAAMTAESLAWKAYHRAFVENEECKSDAAHT